MIIDRFSNFHLYAALKPGIGSAFDFLRQTDLEGLEVGRHAIDGDSLYAVVQRYDTKPMERGIWEAHRRYIDLQVVVQGMERIGYAHLSRLTPGPYDTDRDFLRLDGEGDFLVLKEGGFALFMPEDAHMPGIAMDSSGPVKKVVVKISVDG
jgi:YhcH/YjgK/YiaL family protein